MEQQAETPNSNSKSRIRVSKACDRCRTQKIKCSGTFPCVACNKHKKECVYNTAGVTKQDTRDNNVPTILNLPSRKELPFVMPSDDKEYIRHLENRIQYLESRFSENANDIFLDTRDGETESENNSKILHPTSKWRYSRRSQVLLIQELCRTTYASLTPENREKVALPRQQYFGWNLSGTRYLSLDPLPELPKFELPDSNEFYVGYFFREINPLFAIIHESVFQLQFAGYQDLIVQKQNGPTTKSSEGQYKLYEAMLHLIIALGIRFTEFQKKKTMDLRVLEEEEKMFKYAYSIVSIMSFQWESFELIQCWMLVSLYLRVTHRQASYFHALSHGVTMAKSMGIGNKAREHRKRGTAYEELKCKRIFWSLFSMERVFGLQSGKYCLFSESDYDVDFPPLDFKTASYRDTWITLPSLAMVKIAKAATFVHTSSVEKLDIVKYQQINKELILLNEWLNANGFSDNEVFNNPNESISSLIKAQVKLHYCDLVFCIHGKLMFNYIGRRIATPGLKIEMVLDASKMIVDTIGKIKKANLIYVPWPLNLLLLFHASVNFLVLINCGLYLSVSREYYTKAIEILTVLKRANVKSEDNKIIIRKRFKMAEECLWALKNANKIISLRFEQDLNNLRSLGDDPGSSDVNEATFSQYGYFKDKPDEFNDFIRNGKKRKLNHERTIGDQPTTNLNSNVASTTPAVPNQFEIYTDLLSSVSPSFEAVNDYNPNDPSYIKLGDDLQNQLLWFDQWIDSAGDVDQQLSMELSNSSGN